MDRDKRMERTQIAIDALIAEIGCDEFEKFDQLKTQIQEKYTLDETDEFFKPIRRRGSPRIQSNDNVLFFNFRSDRMRQIVSKLAKVTRPPNIYCMTRYSEDFNFPILSPPQSLSNVLSEVLSKENLRQCHIAGKPFSHS